jgi:Holliday junction resolvasome RuvABC endonuclease subunit
MLSIDPSMRHCGYAVFDGPTLLACGILESSAEVTQNAVTDIASGLMSVARVYNPAYICIEQPTEIHSPAGHAVMHSGALGKLFFTVGFICGAFTREGESIPILIPVREWKGQLPKQLTTLRTNRWYGLNLDWKKKDNNVADAIGLAHYVIHERKTPLR